MAVTVSQHTTDLVLSCRSKFGSVALSVSSVASRFFKVWWSPVSLSATAAPRVDLSNEWGWEGGGGGGGRGEKGAGQEVSGGPSSGEGRVGGGWQRDYKRGVCVYACVCAHIVRLRHQELSSRQGEGRARKETQDRHYKQGGLL